MLIGPFNHQKIGATKVAGGGVLPAVPLPSGDNLSVANVLLPHGTRLLSADMVSAGLGGL